MAGFAPMQNAFRRQLKVELAAWREEGLVSPDLESTLAQRYELDDIEDRASVSIFVVTIYLIGAVLIGGGVISLIAANWGLLPVPIKVGGLLALLIGGHGVGYFFHRRQRPFIAECAFLSTAFIFGACIGIFSQIFHLEGHFSAGFGLWAVGVAAIAFATGSVPVAHVAIVASLIGFVGQVDWYSGAGSLLYVPLLAVLGFGFAWWRPSRIMELSVFIALWVACIATTAAVRGSSDNHALLVAVALAMLSIALSGLPRPIYGVKILGLCASVFLIYWMSFYNALGNLERTARGIDPLEIALSSPMIPILYIVAAIAWTLRLTRPGARRIPSSIEGIILVGLFLILVTWSLRLPTLAVTAHNVVLAALIVAMLWKGVSTAQRWIYWSGIGLAMLVIATRFLEYDTNLLTKAVVFLTCGAGLVYAGVSFERRLKEKGATS